MLNTAGCTGQAFLVHAYRCVLSLKVAKKAKSAGKAGRHIVFTKAHDNSCPRPSACLNESGIHGYYLRIIECRPLNSLHEKEVGVKSNKPPIPSLIAS